MTQTITPTKIAFEQDGDRVSLRVYAPECERGFTTIETTRVFNGSSLPRLRKFAAAYAKRFNIPFIDEVRL